MARAGLAFLSLLVVGCTPAARPTVRTAHPDPAEAALLGDEAQLESTLHQLDLLEAKIYSFYDARADPIAACASGNREVMTRKVAFKLIVDRQLTSDKAVEGRYYDLLQRGQPAEIIPVIHLRRYYHESLLRCILDLADKKLQEEDGEANNVSIFTSSNFGAETSHGVVIIDFMTHWCVPCKRMAPDLGKLAQHYRGELKIGRLNVDRNMQLAERFGVRKLPTLLILKDGREAGRLEGSGSYPDLERWAQGVLQKGSSPPPSSGGEHKTGDPSN